MCLEELFKIVSGMVSCTHFIGVQRLPVDDDAVRGFFNRSVHDIFEKDRAFSEIQEFFRQMRPGALYMLQSRFLTEYMVLVAPEPEREYWVFGPCLTEEMSPNLIYRATQKNAYDGVTEADMQLYFSRLPFLTMAGLRALGCEVARHLYQSEDAPEGVRLCEEGRKHKPERYVNNHESMLGMRVLEERYQNSDAFFDAVRHGEIDRAFHIYQHVREEIAHIQRNPDPMRNLKNHTIILNSQLRQLSSDSGVHPVFIDRLSNDYGLQIERCAKEDQLARLHEEMIRSYCLLIRQHALPRVSSLVKRAAAYVHMNLSQPLTAAGVAKQLNVNADYFSHRFKQQMGCGFSEYVNKQRIEHAVHLLDESEMQIQQIAVVVGYNDINYFSRVFRQYVNRSPRDYRKLAAKHNKRVGNTGN